MKKDPFEDLYLKIKYDILFNIEIKQSKINLLSILASLISIRMFPVYIYRISYFFNIIYLKPVAKLFSLLNFIFFGIEIAINTNIGGGLFLPHTQGIVIGAISIGEKAIIYHNVTIGAKFIDTSNELLGRPKIGNNVKIATGSIIVGSIEIGDNVIIAPNLVISKSVESNSKIIVNV
jgi:serine O-acetyltransferase